MDSIICKISEYKIIKQTFFLIPGYFMYLYIKTLFSASNNLKTTTYIPLVSLLIELLYLLIKPLTRT